jgi:hypothetical protein
MTALVESGHAPTEFNSWRKQSPVATGLLQVNCIAIELRNGYTKKEITIDVFLWVEIFP